MDSAHRRVFHSAAIVDAVQGAKRKQCKEVIKVQINHV